MVLRFLCPGTPEGSIGSGSGFKASQKTVPRLRISSDRLGEAGNRTRDPWFTRHRFIPYTTVASQRNNQSFRQFDFSWYVYIMSKCDGNIVDLFAAHLLQ